MKLALLWTFATDYVHAMVARAVDRGHEVMLVLQDDLVDLPQAASGHAEAIALRRPSAELLFERLDSFRPDVLLVAGWHIPEYRQASAHMRGRATRTMAFDAQWYGTIKQRIGQIAFRTTWRNLFDSVLVPGEKQYEFARRVGFSAPSIYMGSIPANDLAFRAENVSDKDRSFLTVSRFAPEKGIDVLVDGYEAYRRRVDGPWTLRLGGRGEVEPRRTEGVELMGYLPPSRVAAEMRRAGCFVLASVFEPWGVVLHEAALSGCPIIATDACGAVGTFVLNGQNGIVVPAGDVGAMRRALERISVSGPVERARMGRTSQTLGARSTRDTWVDALERVVFDARIP